MTGWNDLPPSVRLRRAADELASAATVHTPGAVPRVPIGAIADIRATIADVEATERALAQLLARARDGGWWTD